MRSGSASRALVENDLDRALLLARQGVALDDSVQTRGNLLAALLKSPAAIGVMRGAGERMSAVALSPDERTLAAGDHSGNVLLLRHARRGGASPRSDRPGTPLVDRAARLQPGRQPPRDRARHPAGDGNVVTVFDTAAAAPSRR